MTENWRDWLARRRFSVVEVTGAMIGTGWVVHDRWLLAVLALIVGGISQAILEKWPA